MGIFSWGKSSNSADDKLPIKLISEKINGSTNLDIKSKPFVAERAVDLSPTVVFKGYIGGGKGPAISKLENQLRTAVLNKPSGKSTQEEIDKLSQDLSLLVSDHLAPTGQKALPSPNKVITDWVNALANPKQKLSHVVSTYAVKADQLKPSFVFKDILGDSQLFRLKIAERKYADLIAHPTESTISSASSKDSAGDTIMEILKSALVHADKAKHEDGAAQTRANDALNAWSEALMEIPRPVKAR